MSKFEEQDFRRFKAELDGGPGKGCSFLSVEIAANSEGAAPIADVAAALRELADRLESEG
jgi:hypothetical protein